MVIPQQFVLYLCAILCRNHEDFNHESCSNECQGPLPLRLENANFIHENTNLKHENLNFKNENSNPDCTKMESESIEDIPHEKYARIMGGKHAEITRFPYAAFLYIEIMERWGNKRYKQCSGSIIHERAILTAAHCVPLRNINDYVSVTAVVGNTSIQRGTRVRIIKIIQHERYSRNKKDFNDIAIAIMEGRLRYSDRIYPIAIGTDVSGSRCRSFLAGWGVTTGGRVADTLMYTKMTVITQDECLKMVLLADNVFCAMGCTQSYPYHGDSGSALVYEGVQIGILSRGTSQVSVFTDLYYYIDWIEEKLQNEFRESYV